MLLNEYEGNLDAKNKRFCVVASRFNDFIVEKLVDGARGMLKKLGATDVDVAWVPGAYKLGPHAPGGPRS